MQMFLIAISVTWLRAFNIKGSQCIILRLKGLFLIVNMKNHARHYLEHKTSSNFQDGRMN